MRQISNDVWVAEQPLRFIGGVELGTRMTALRLRDGGLFLYSPVKLSDELQRALTEIGLPRYVVAPNRFHHLFVGEYRNAFPDIQLFAAPGLPEKRPDLRFDGVLPDDAPEAWKDELDIEFFAGMPMMNEILVHHRASRSLLLCDLAFQYGPEAPWLTRTCFRLVGAYDRFGPTVLEKLLIRDRAKARASLERILSWNFDRVILPHGKILDSGGTQALRDGYHWLLDG